VAGSLSTQSAAGNLDQFRVVSVRPTPIWDTLMAGRRKWLIPKLRDDRVVHGARLEILNLAAHSTETAHPSNGTLDVLGVQLRLGGRDETDTNQDHAERDPY
jgi:hypothetical protein